MDEKILETLKQIKEYCESIDCKDCRFTDGTRCFLAGSPTGWMLKIDLTVWCVHDTM